MQFRTEINLPVSLCPISHSDKILFAGSCFTQNIGQLMLENKFSALINPTGIIYNPMSVAKTLVLLSAGMPFTKNDLFFDGQNWLSFDHHGSFSDPDAAVCLARINQQLQKGSKQLNAARYLVLTFGTAYVYYRKDTQQAVANCHKLPDHFYDRRRLSVDEIVIAYEPLLRKLFEQNENIRLILTVSPIRHWKDGAADNQLSKATLILAVHELKNMFADRIDYFPAYELLLDDLRDYRFYADDLLHPSNTAIQYIWQKFKSVYFTSQTLELMATIEKIRKAFKHKPLQPQSETYKSFARQQVAAILELLQQYPNLPFEEELTYFEQTIG